MFLESVRLRYVLEFKMERNRMQHFLKVSCCFDLETQNAMFMHKAWKNSMRPSHNGQKRPSSCERDPTFNSSDRIQEHTARVTDNLDQIFITFYCTIQSQSTHTQKMKICRLCIKNEKSECRLNHTLLKSSQRNEKSSNIYIYIYKP